MSLLSLVPWPYRLLGLLALVGAIFGYGLVKGLEIGQDRLEAFQEAQEAIANKARVQALSAQLKRQENATEAVNAVQARLRIVDAKYRGLRDHPNSSPVSSLPKAPGVPGPVPGDLDESDADARCLAVLEIGDRELAKYAELWRLQLKNSVPNSSGSGAN